jgi:hypothetical protein
MFSRDMDRQRELVKGFTDLSMHWPLGAATTLAPPNQGIGQIRSISHPMRHPNGPPARRTTSRKPFDFRRFRRNGTRFSVMAIPLIYRLARGALGVFELTLTAALHAEIAPVEQRFLDMRCRRMINRTRLEQRLVMETKTSYVLNKNYKLICLSFLLLLNA